MADRLNEALTDVEAMTDEQLTSVEAEERARRIRAARAGEVTKGLGNMGGAGAQGGIQPDVANISQPAVKP
jgi:hypothetical protein